MDKELQRQTLLVQLKILKELRLLNNNFYNFRQHNGRHETQLNNYELDDIKEAVAETGKTFI